MRTVGRMLLMLALVLTALTAVGAGRVPRIVVADSASHIRLPNATVYDREGRPIAMTDDRGRIPRFLPAQFPLTIRYLGFREQVVPGPETDTVFLSEIAAELPEVVIETRGKRLLHLLAYVREYSTMTTYTDTIFLFREKMVDFMLNPDPGKIKFTGWETPRLLTGRSYYRFTNDRGLDSVSDHSPHYFSWSDWIGAAPKTVIPASLLGVSQARDTIFGAVSPSEIWRRDEDRISIGVDVLADPSARSWVPGLNAFFRKDLEFDRFRINFDYEGIEKDSVTPADLAGFSFRIDSRGRAHRIFRFNRYDEPFFVTTSAEVYILDREYITLKEAKKWEKGKFDIDEIGILEPLDAPDLSPETLALIDRVNTLDKESVRLDFRPDYRLVSTVDSRRNFKIGRRALFMLKGATGISAIKRHRHLRHEWDSFRRDRLRLNSLPPDSITDQ